MNPLENEAVIAHAMNNFPGQCTILDVSSELPDLIRRPGITKWKVSVNKDLTMFDTYESYLETLSEKQKKESKIIASQFPPHNAESLGLENCLRLYPQLQDTGGFFVAVICKAAVNTVPQPEEAVSAPAEPTTIGPSDSSAKRPASEPETSEPVKKLKTNTEAAVPTATASTEKPAESTTETVKETGGTFKEAPFVFLSEDSPVLRKCLTQLNIKDTFPSTRLFVRNQDIKALRSVYLCSPLVKSIMEHNNYTKIRLINCGVKVFIRHGSVEDAIPNFRFAEDGVDVLLNDVDQAKLVTGGIKELRKLLETYYPLCDSFSEPFSSTIKALPFGSALMRVGSGEWEGAHLRYPLNYPIWKSQNSICLMIDKKSKSALSLRLFGTDVTEAAAQTSEKRKERTGELAKQVGTSTASASSITAIVADIEMDAGLTQEESGVALAMAMATGDQERESDIEVDPNITDA
jgi:multisite-specific tRNA:(cytosine-C5)-methyltransferase